MLKIIGKPDSGKTKKLLMEIEKDGGVIVCSHPHKMLNKALNYGVNVGNINFVRYSDYLTGNKMLENVYIDDLDSFLVELDYHIKGYNVDEQ